jgi:hypothetical protein
MFDGVILILAYRLQYVFNHTATDLQLFVLLDADKLVRDLDVCAKSDFNPEYS